jgi:hypothetical protein
MLLDIRPVIPFMTDEAKSLAPKVIHVFLAITF